MNVGQIKAFMGDQKADQTATVHPNEVNKKQLQQDGLRQVAEFARHQAASVYVSSNQTTIGFRVVSTSLSQSLVIDGQHPESIKDKNVEDASTNTFDYEKIARNVLKFVGGVIRGAANGGASEDKLNELFSQAREGVSRGFEMAGKELEGFMNDEIEQGMTKSRELIDTGINELEDDIFGRSSNDSVAISALNAVSASDERSGNLVIKTKDGDEVTFSFESFRAFQAAQQISVSAQYSETARGNGQGQDSEAQQNYAFHAQRSSSYQYYERSGISFSLKGELDEDELKSIADLIGQIQDLADTFFSGDIEKAFEEAMSLGFDDKELVGYALQLNRTTQTEVLKTYENIKHYNDEREDRSKYGNVVSPISQYLDKMMSTFENAESKLASSDDYNTLITGLFSKMEDFQTSDIVSAINQFHSFNRKLLEALPQTTESKE